MKRISIFGTQRPDIGTLIKFDTPGQNETQLDEDKFEEKIIKFFEARKYCSNKRVIKTSLEIWGSGKATDYFNVIGRAFALMDNLPGSSYSKTHLGYVKL
jgi:hypothetical protein